MLPDNFLGNNLSLRHQLSLELTVINLGLLAPPLRPLARCRRCLDFHIPRALGQKTCPFIIHTFAFLSLYPPPFLLAFHHSLGVSLSNQSHITRKNLLKWNRYELPLCIEPLPKGFAQFHFLPIALL